MTPKRSVDPSRLRVVIHFSEEQTVPIVKLASGPEFPQQIAATALYDDGPPIRLFFEVEDGRAVVSSMSITRPEGGAPISASLIRGLKFSEIVDETVATIAQDIRNLRREHELTGLSYPPGHQPAQVLAASEIVDVRHAAVLSRRGRPVGDGPLRRVGEIVNANDFDPRADIRSEFHVSLRTASRWIATARERGFLVDRSSETEV